MDGSWLSAGVAAVALTAFAGASSAAPRLSLVKAGTASAASDSIPPATAVYSLDLRANTDGNSISSLQLYVLADPAGAVKYGSTPLTPLNNPFTADEVSGPAAGATAQQSGAGRTAFARLSEGDYPAFADNAIARYQVDTSTLAPGTYVFTPVGEELTNAQTTITTFAAPGTFSLMVLPEPASLALLGFGGGGALLLRPGRRAGR